MLPNTNAARIATLQSRTVWSISSRRDSKLMLSLSLESDTPSCSTVEAAAVLVLILGGMEAAGSNPTPLGFELSVILKRWEVWKLWEELAALGFLEGDSSWGEGSAAGAAAEPEPAEADDPLPLPFESTTIGGGARPGSGRLGAPGDAGSTVEAAPAEAAAGLPATAGGKGRTGGGELGGPPARAPPAGGGGGFDPAAAPPSGETAPTGGHCLTGGGLDIDRGAVAATGAAFASGLSTSRSEVSTGAHFLTGVEAGPAPVPAAAGAVDEPEPGVASEEGARFRKGEFDTAEPVVGAAGDEAVPAAEEGGEPFAAATGDEAGEAVATAGVAAAGVAAAGVAAAAAAG